MQPGFSIGMYLDKSPLSINKASETSEFFKFITAFFVSIFDIINEFFPTIFFTKFMSW